MLWLAVQQMSTIVASGCCPKSIMWEHCSCSLPTSTGCCTTTLRNRLYHQVVKEVTGFKELTWTLMVDLQMLVQWWFEWRMTHWEGLWSWNRVCYSRSLVLKVEEHVAGHAAVVGEHSPQGGTIHTSVQSEDPCGCQTQSCPHFFEAGFAESSKQHKVALHNLMKQHFSEDSISPLQAATTTATTVSSCYMKADKMTVAEPPILEPAA